MKISTDDTTGFIVIDNYQALYGITQPGTSKVLHKFQADMPERGGGAGRESAMRTARRRLEKLHVYLIQVSEVASQLFIADNGLNIKRLVIAGPVEFATRLSKSDLLDKRLVDIMLNVMDMSEGGEPGFKRAVALSLSCDNHVDY